MTEDFQFYIYVSVQRVYFSAFLGWHCWIHFEKEEKFMLKIQDLSELVKEYTSSCSSDQ